MSTSFDDIALQQQRYTMDSEEAARQRAVLMAMVAGEQSVQKRHGGRRKALVMAIAAVSLGIGAVGTAAALGVFSQEPPDRSTAFCYASADLSDANSNRVEFAVSDESGGSGVGDAAAQGLEICSMYWKSGVLVVGSSPNLDVMPDPDADGTAPPLTACVIPSGQLAVFPGGPAVCEQLGLPNAEL